MKKRADKLKLHNIVICLSHQVTKPSKLSEDSLKRIELASNIFFDKKCDFLITTGWSYRSDMKITLAELMADRATKEFGVSKDKLYLEESSKDTVGEAVFSRKKFLDELKVSKLYVVTSDWHLKRAKEVFSFVYGNKNYPEILFKTIKGSKEARIKEESNNSLNEFKAIFSVCEAGSIESIYNVMIQKHKLYNS